MSNKINIIRDSKKPKEGITVELTEENPSIEDQFFHRFYKEDSSKIIHFSGLKLRKITK